jgi:hypothetical protein
LHNGQWLLENTAELMRDMYTHRYHARMGIFVSMEDLNRNNVTPD